MKKLFIYLITFIKTFFRQLFNSEEIKKVEIENIVKKIQIQNKEKTFSKLRRKGSMLSGRTGNAAPRFQRPCLGCGKPIFVAMGQLAFWHSECRKKGRKLSLNARYGRS